MKNIARKIAAVLKVVFGYGIMICLFAGGAMFLGYLAALIIGGQTAATICAFIYEQITPIVIKASTILVLLGLVIMYLTGDKALTADKKQSSKHEGEL